VAVNMAVWPPLQDRLRRSTGGPRSTDGSGGCSAGSRPRCAAGHTTEQTSSWIDEVNGIDQRIDDAWGSVRQAG
jgi:hypothetical protein